MVLLLVACAFGLVAVALLVTAGKGAAETPRLRRSGTRSRATVRELKTRELNVSDDSSSDGLVYAPVFEFLTPDGRTHQMEGHASSPPRYAVGDQVSAVFDPADPGAARVETFAGLWLGVALTALGGSVTGGVALLLFWLAR